MRAATPLIALEAVVFDIVQQGIPYVKDPYNNGHDYPKYPIETIVDRGGDCEDKSALLVALLNTFGFDAVMVALPGHMAAALNTDRSGSYYLHNNKKYFYIETTSVWKIGSVPPKFKKAKAKILDVARPEQYVRDGGVVFEKQINADQHTAFLFSRALAASACVSNTKQFDVVG